MISSWISKLSHSNIILFGRVVEDLSVTQPGAGHHPSEYPRTRSNKLLETQLGAGAAGNAPALARIYGFSYEGTYYDMPFAAMFLVHGAGAPASELQGTAKMKKPKPSRAPQNPSITGIAAADFDFADDVLMWSYDKSDYSIRLDISSGMLEQILLGMLDGGPGGGWGRVAGAKVSGAKVAGAKVSGAKLSGRWDPSD